MKVESPWQEILSSASRKKRSVDAWEVGTIKKELSPGPAALGESGLNLTQPSDPTPGGSLQEKIGFISTLHLNPRYKQYLRHLKFIKLKKMLISKFASKLSDAQIKKVKKGIAIHESLLDQLFLQPGEKKTENAIKIQGKEEMIIKPGHQTVSRSEQTAMNEVEVLPFIDLNKPAVVALNGSEDVKMESATGGHMMAINVPIDEILDHSYVKSQFSV